MTTCCMRCFNSFNPYETWCRNINSKWKGSVNLQDLYIESYHTLGIPRALTSLSCYNKKNHTTQIHDLLTPHDPKKISSHKSMLQADPGSTTACIMFGTTPLTFAVLLVIGAGSCKLMQLQMTSVLRLRTEKGQRWKGTVDVHLQKEYDT